MGCLGKLCTRNALIEILYHGEMRRQLSHSPIEYRRILATGKEVMFSSTRTFLNGKVAFGRDSQSD
jgi:hypothetical protein